MAVRSVKEFTMFSSTRRFRGMLRARIILVAYRSPYDEDTWVTDCHVPSTLSLSDNIKILRHIFIIISITFLQEFNFTLSHARCSRDVKIEEVEIIILKKEK